MLNKRSKEREELDNLDLKGDALHQTMDELAMINKYLGNTSTTLQTVCELLEKEKVETLKIIDLGCGGGDNLRSIAKWCKENDKKVKLCGIDGNPNILNYAQNKNGESFQIEYKEANILDPQFEIEPCDILISSHFMYHFTDEKLAYFLKTAKNKVRKTIIISELQRSFFAFTLFKMTGWLLPFSKMIKQDGLKAIQRSFKRTELKDILEKAGFTSYTLNWRWAFRYLLIISFSNQ